MSKRSLCLVGVLLGALLVLAALPATALTPPGASQERAPAVLGERATIPIAAAGFAPAAAYLPEAVSGARAMGTPGLLLVLGAGLVVLAELLLLPGAWRRSICTGAKEGEGGS